MHKHPDYTRTRIAQILPRIEAKIYTDHTPLELTVAGPVGRILRAEALKLSYKPAKAGLILGPLWATYWFKAKARVPKSFAGERVELIWNSHSEATLWVGGKVQQAMSHDPLSWGRFTRTAATLLPKAKGGESLSFEVEVACNGLFGDRGSKPFKSLPDYVLDQADIAVYHADAWELYHDLSVLIDLESESAKDGQIDRTYAGHLLYELNRFANAFDVNDRSTWPAASKILKALYKNKNEPLVHEVSAIGHAHIDTAWLWPLAETSRKCQRTFSNQLRLMEEYPQYKFSCSQAYQYEDIRQTSPYIFEQIVKATQRGQWVPVGGTWIEPDCNIPSGEALARQFLYGQRYFEKNLGARCNEFWNPDVFGYNGQLPQIMALSGIKRFLTQKLSWNRFNKPHHHTFEWEGIDGTRVLAHFPPADTYNAFVSVNELRKNARDYKDNDRSRHSMMLFGFGDGGGGPTRRMLEYATRAKDLRGLPRVALRSSDDFFDLLEKDCTDRPLMVGELYFEYHRGTYTTQAANKRDNRKAEFLLHDAEMLSVIAERLTGRVYPGGELEELWKVVLLNQFHDILPGSSINQVYKDSAVHYAKVLADTAKIADGAARALTAGNAKVVTPMNTTSFARQDVVNVDGRLLLAECPPCGVGHFTDAVDEVTVTRKGGQVVLENHALRAALDEQGRLLSLIHKDTGRETIAAPANNYVIYDDLPTAYDAWDVDPYHMETPKPCGAARFVRTTSDALRGEAHFVVKVGKKSSMTFVVRLDAHAERLEFHCDVDWAEDNKMLKAEFPVNVRSMDATYEMQFGAVQRPTHFNTSYDLARYEVPGHKWSDLSEHGFGVALLSESKYGYSTFGNTMRISLLRSPKSPDPTADMGKHHFAYALYPHPGDWRSGGVVAEGFRFNSPVRLVPGRLAAQSYAEIVDDQNLVLDTMKRAEDSAAIIVRLYEAHGARGTASLRLNLPFKKVQRVNILEDKIPGEPIEVDGSTIHIPYGPYQIITLMLT